MVSFAVHVLVVFTLETTGSLTEQFVHCTSIKSRKKKKT